MAYYTNPYSNFPQGGNFGNTYPNTTNAYSAQPQQPEPVFRWVQGRAGAEAYSLAPGQSAFLMDSNEPVLYAKATDSYGRYMPLQSYKLVPMEEQSMSSAQIAAPTETIDYEKIRQMIAEEVSKISNQNDNRNKKEGR